MTMTRLIRDPEKPACGNCTRFDPDAPGVRYLEGGDGFCRRPRISTKLAERRSTGDWCDQHAPRQPANSSEEPK